MLRVLVAGFCAVPGPSRAGVQLGHVVRALSRRSRVDVLAARRAEQPYVERTQRVRFLRVPIPDAPLAERAEAFRRALRRQLEGADYDVVHVRDGWSASVVVELQSRLRYAVVFDAARATLADPSEVDPETLPALVDMETASLRQSDLVLAPTESARRYLASLTRPERVCLVPPGVDVDRFDWDDPDEEGPARILYLGAIAPAHGIRLLVRAMLEVARRSDARLVLAGPADREFRERTLEAAGALGVADRLELPGEIAHEDVPDLIARATLCVAPNAVELGPTPTALFPSKLLEYMACRRPVVAARRSAATLLVRDGENGLLFTPGDPADLAERLAALIGDPDLRGRVADAGYELVRRHYSASGTRRALRRAYDTLANTPEWSEHFARARHRDERERLEREEVAAVGAMAMSRLGSEDLGPGESVGDDITTVEAPSFAGTDEELDEGLPPVALGEETGEDWVVEDSLTREHRLGDTPAAPSAPASTSEEGEKTPPVEGSFVAGELDIPASLDDDASEKGPFSAVSSLLGGGDETDERPAPAPAKGEDEGGESE